MTVQRPKVRAADGSDELPVAAYELFSGTELVGRLTLERMLGGLSTRRYPVGLDPVGAQAEQAASLTSRSSRGCWQGRVAHQCAGVAGAVGVRAWPVGPRRGGRAGRGAGAGGGAFHVDRGPHLRGDQAPVRRLEAPWSSAESSWSPCAWAVAICMRAGARAEAVSCAWGITTQGSPVLVGLASGSDDGHDPWAAFSASWWTAL